MDKHQAVYDCCYGRGQRQKHGLNDRLSLILGLVLSTEHLTRLASNIVPLALKQSTTSTCPAPLR